METHMIRVAKRDGSYEDVEANTAELLGGFLILRDEHSQVVSSFRAEEVLAHGPPETLPKDQDEGRGLLGA